MRSNTSSAKRSSVVTWKSGLRSHGRRTSTVSRWMVRGTGDGGRGTGDGGRGTGDGGRGTGDGGRGHSNAGWAFVAVKEVGISAGSG